MYASTRKQVLRWAYTDGSRSSLSAGSAQTVVHGIPGGMSALLLDKEGRLYVSVTSQGGNPGSIRQFETRSSIDASGFAFDAGVLVAGGLGRTLGLGIAPGTGELWGVDDWVSRPTTDDDDDDGDAPPIERPDLNAGPSSDNGGDGSSSGVAVVAAPELNYFPLPDDSSVDTERSWGFPECFTSGNTGATQQLARTVAEATHDDTWCRDNANNRAPILRLPQYSAPLGLAFFDGTGCTNTSALAQGHRDYNMNGCPVRECSSTPAAVAAADVHFTLACCDTHYWTMIRALFAGRLGGRRGAPLIQN